MNTGRVTIGILTALCLLLAIAWGNAAKHADRLRAQLEQGATPQLVTPVTPAATAKEKLLQRLLDERVAAYAKLSAGYDELKKKSDEPAAQPVAAVTSRDRDPGENPTAWLERLRTEDPKRYQQVVEWREQRQRQADQWVKDQMASLDKRAQSAPTKEEASLVNQVADTLDRINQLRQDMRDAQNLPDDQRQAQTEQLSAQMRNAYQALHTLRDQDRAMQLQNLATQLGLRGSSVQSLVESVPQIYQNTQYNTPQRGPGRGGDGGFGMPPPPAASK